MASAFKKLIVDLDLNASGYQLGLKKAEGQMKRFGDEIGKHFKGAVAAAFGVAALEEMARKAMETAENLVNLSRETSVSTDALQEWGRAARMAGSNLEEVSKFLEHIAAVREKALAGDTDAQLLFGKFGISKDDIGDSIDSLARRIGEAFAKSRTNLTNSLKEIGGKGATGLIPLFREGFDANCFDVWGLMGNWATGHAAFESGKEARARWKTSLLSRLCRLVTSSSRSDRILIVTPKSGC